MQIENRSILRGESLRCSESSVLNDIRCNVRIGIAEMGEWYDYNYIIDVDGFIKNGMITFSVKLDKCMKDGIYFITSVELIDKATNSTIFNKDFRTKNGNRNGLEFHFGNKRYSDEYINEMFNENRLNRELEFNKCIGDMHISDAIRYDVIMFCKDIYIEGHAEYGQIEIVPYKSLGYSSEIDYIRSFFKDYKINLSINSEKLNLLDSHNRPSAAIHIPNIAACSPERAGDIALDRGNKLINIIGLLRKSHGEIWGIYLLDKQTGKKYFKFVNDGYKGNLISGIMGGEKPEEIRSMYKLVCNDKNTKYNIYLSLLNDAIKESDIVKKYYRFWNIIESMAKDKDYLNLQIKHWNGEVALNRKGESMKIQTSIHLVTELIREYYSKEYTEKEVIGDNIKFDKVSAFLEVCYRRRNCCVHYGGCFKENSNICDTSKTVYKLCNESISEVLGIDPMNDNLLLGLEKLVVEILKSNLLGKNSIDKDDMTIEMRQHTQCGKFIEI